MPAKNKNGTFLILSLSRRELELVGFNAHSVSDRTLTKLAGKLAALCRHSLGRFSLHLEYEAQKLRIPRIHKTRQEKAFEELQMFLLDLHIFEILRKGSNIYNLGSIQESHRIVSKTSCGTLESRLSAKTQEVTQKWRR